MTLAHLRIAAICILSFAWGSAALAQPGVFQTIAPGIWFRETAGGCNNVIIEMGDHLVVIDANYPGLALDLVRDIKDVSTKPIKLVIDTHHHPDHLYGNHVFTRLGAKTIGHVGILEELKRYEPDMWRGVAKTRKDMASAADRDGPEPPQETYSESPHVIADGSRRIELQHFTFGHTRGDTFVYLPQEKILCTGDAVVNGPFSDPKHAYIRGWAEEIRAAQKLDVETVLPGHGPPADKTLLASQIEFFEELHKTVEAAIKAGKRRDDLVTMKDDRAVATTVQLPKHLMERFVFSDPKLPWQISRFPTQVFCTYEEIAQGKPWGDIAGRKPQP
jgi:glyoxylase-like metal-dependent hydrolase (beta-lactamase superfamily II)